MNSRTTIVNDKEVRIKPVPYAASNLVVQLLDSGLLQFRCGIGLDTEAQAALSEALSCLRYTGTFAALSDESKVPYVGKRMRRIGGEEITILEKDTDPGLWLVQSYSPAGSALRCCISESSLLPLFEPQPPKKKYRPYKDAKEALPLIGRKVVRDGFTLMIIMAVGDDGAYSSDGSWYSYRTLFEEYKYTDTWLPVGVEE